MNALAVLDSLANVDNVSIVCGDITVTSDPRPRRLSGSSAILWRATNANAASLRPEC